MVVTYQKVLKIRNKQVTDHDFLLHWLLNSYRTLEVELFGA